MKTLNRRSFIKIASCTVGSACLSSIPFVSRAGNQKKEKAGTALLLKRKASEAFYRRNYKLAEELYGNLVKEYPSDISCYDGLAKVFYQRHDYISVIRLFEDALGHNENMHMFYDRLSRAYKRLSLGNLKQKTEYGKEELFSKSVGLYLKAMALAPDKVYLRMGLLDTLNSLSKKNNQLEKRGEEKIVLPEALWKQINEKTNAYKNKWEHRSVQKEDSTLSDKEIENKISKLSNRSRRKLYFDDEYQERYKTLERKKKAYLSILFYRSIAKKDANKAGKLYSSISSCEARDTQIKGKFIAFLEKQENYSFLENFYRNEMNTNPCFWTNIGLARAVFLRARKENNIIGVNDSLSMYKELQLKQNEDAFSAKACGAISNGLNDGNIFLNGYSKGREELLKGLQKIGYGGIADSLYIKYAENYLREGNSKQAEQILLVINRKIEISQENISNDPLLSVVKDASKHKKYLEENGIVKKKRKNRGKRLSDMSLRTTIQEGNEENKNVDMLYSLAKLYRQTGDTPSLEKILNEIRGIDPNSSFLRKRRK